MIQTKCDYCGKNIERVKSKIERHKRHFCNKDCYFKHTHIEIKCDHCGKLHTQQKCNVNRRKHHFCSKKCSEVYAIGKPIHSIRQKIDLTPTYQLGWACGAIMGDGSVWKNKSSKGIAFGSIEDEMIQRFYRYIQTILIGYKPNLYNGRITTKGNQEYRFHIACVNFYEKLKPFKPEPCRWAIPSFLTTEKSIKGFIAGVFDSDGCISKDHKYNGKIRLWSKYKEGLLQIKNILEVNSMEPRIYRRRQGRYECYELTLIRNRDLILFREKFGFKLFRKQEKLEQIINNFYRKPEYYLKGLA